MMICKVIIICYFVISLVFERLSYTMWLSSVSCLCDVPQEVLLKLYQVLLEVSILSIEALRIIGADDIALNQIIDKTFECFDYLTRDSEGVSFP